MANDPRTPSDTSAEPKAANRSTKKTQSSAGGDAEAKPKRGSRAKAGDGQAGSEQAGGAKAGGAKTGGAKAASGKAAGSKASAEKKAAGGKQTADKASKGTGRAKKTGSAQSDGASQGGQEVTSEQISRRAYEIYQQRGGVHGRHEDDWRQAERELRGGR
jgi:hypothetical protein